MSLSTAPLASLLPLAAAIRLGGAVPAPLLACWTSRAGLLPGDASGLSGLGAREMGGFVCLFQLLPAALIGAASTGHPFDPFVRFQVAALSSYGLTGFFPKRPIALEAAPSAR